jgi:uncharacterized protein (DUF302 family)
MMSGNTISGREEGYMLYVRETRGSVDEVAKRLEEAAVANQFGVLGVHDLKQKMKAKGVAFDKECRIFEVCNPGKAKTVLQSNMAISTALPCRISIFEEAGKVKIATIKPTAMLAMFDQPELASVAKEVEETIERIIDAACA